MKSEIRSVIDTLLRGEEVVAEADSAMTLAELEEKFPVEEFKGIINKRAGFEVPGLTIGFKDRRGGPGVTVTSGNIVDKTGIMSKVFKEVVVDDFGGGSFDEEGHGPTVAVPVHLSWVSYGGGTNGRDWFTAYYRFNTGEWVFKDAEGNLE